MASRISRVAIDTDGGTGSFFTEGQVVDIHGRAGVVPFRITERGDGWIDVERIGTLRARLHSFRSWLSFRLWRLRLHF